MYLKPEEYLNPYMILVLKRFKLFTGEKYSFLSPFDELPYGLNCYLIMSDGHYQGQNIACMAVQSIFPECFFVLWL